MKPHLVVDNTETETPEAETPKKKRSILQGLWDGLAWLGIFTATLIAYTIYQGV